jgi:DNA repair protein RecO (recombination protein O)
MTNPTAGRGRRFHGRLTVGVGALRNNAGVSYYRDNGVVLRTQKLGEADRIVTLLMRRHGRVRLAAKGVRRTSSRFGARLEPFSHVDIQCVTGRSLDIATQVVTLDPFGGMLSRDYARWTAGSAMLEAAERFAENEGEPALRQYLLLVGGLRALAQTPRDPVLVLDAFLIRSLALGGYAPSFDACAGCGAPGPHRFFTIPGGGATCAACRPAACAAPGADTLMLLSALLNGDWDTAEAAEGRARREASGLVAAYLQWHLERGLRSLRHVERDGQLEPGAAQA